MSQKARSGSTNLTIIMFLGILSGLQPAHAIRRDWSPEERQCAGSIGVQPDQTYRRPETSLRTLTWISPLVIRGTVSKVESDIEGAYHTIATVNVDAVEKGSALGPTIKVMLATGSAFSPQRGQIGYARYPNEPTFTIDEKVLLFLDTDYFLKGREDTFRLQTGEYTLAPKGKYLIVGNTIRNTLFPVEQHPLDTALSEIHLTTQKQATLCAQ